MCHALEKCGTLVRLAALLFVALAVGSCGSGNVDPASGSRVFIADSATDAIGSVDSPNPPPGNIQVNRTINGTSSNGIVGNIPALLLDAARDQLYVSNEIQISVFNNARFASGPIAYSRRVATFSGSGNFNSMSLDSTRDYLYVGDLSNGVRVFHNASTANESGTTTNIPTRTISTANIGLTLSVRDIALDPGKDILYVAVDTFTGPSSMSILVFDGASGLNSSALTPNRTIAITTGVFGTMGLFIDTAHDRLYFADSGGGISIFENASTKDGAVPPDKSVGLPSTVLRLTVDTVNDRLYAVGSSALYVVPGISAAPPGPLTATVVQAGPGSIFTAVAIRP